MSLSIGMNGRFFPGNWRAALTEIAFARRGGFQVLQFRGHPEGLSAAQLGDPLGAVAEALSASGVGATMELLIRVTGAGETPEGLSPLEVLEANLPAIRELPCTHVHWHLVPAERLTDAQARDLEARLVPQFGRAADVALDKGFRFGVEHNEPALKLFAPPSSCARLLEQVHGLGLLWDFNHTALEDLAAYQALSERVMGLHIADTRLPETNEHLPLGMGNLDVAGYCAGLLRQGFSGPGILEIGGLPKSGGYGRDTDEALLESAQRLREAVRG